MLCTTLLRDQQKMKVVALISGGKDSCYNMMQCVAEGHEIVALANLKPQNKDELDSYMYQTVGHHAIDLYADAMQLPLYRREIRGTSLELGADYQQNENDEVEDLYQLLLQIKNELDVSAVAVGAILSDYQRVRVENVCSRLGLSVLAYLWRRDQTELLAEMIACNVQAIVIKVATLGLSPKDHLGKTIQELQPHLLKMSKLYGLNVCGEGGEYETFTLDCPLFHKRIVIDELEMVMHSADAFAPVAYLNLKKMHLEDKLVKICVTELLRELPLKHSRSLVSELFYEGYKCEDESLQSVAALKNLENANISGLQHLRAGTIEFQSCPSVRKTEDGFTYIAGLVARQSNGSSIVDEVRTMLEKLKDTLTMLNLTVSDLVAVHLYVANMGDFAAINTVYKNFFSLNPPVRVCVEVPFEEKISLCMDCIAYKAQSESVVRRTMHVQGISHWAPANIGPYSQAIMLGQEVFVAGQIALCPATMTMVNGSQRTEARLSLRHVDRILKAMNAVFCLSHLTLAICYVTDVSAMSLAIEELKHSTDPESNGTDISGSLQPQLPLVVCVCVPSLPRQAKIEWHVTAAFLEGNRKECFETSTVKDGIIFNISGRKHWISENSFLLPFIISVELATDEVREFSLHKMMPALMFQLANLLKNQGLNLQNLRCLRLLFSSQHSSLADLQNAFSTEFCHTFQCKLEESATAFVPVCGFHSNRCVMVLSHC